MYIHQNVEYHLWVVDIMVRFAFFVIFSVLFELHFKMSMIFSQSNEKAIFIL